MKRLCILVVACVAALAAARLAITRPAGGHPEPSPAAGGIRFTDVTDATGIRFTHCNGGSGAHFYVETMSAGCAVLDYDGDGWQDALLTQGAALPGFTAAKPLRSALYRNNRDGTFTDVTKGSGLDTSMYAMGIAVGDYDNDGRPDIYITALGGNRLFHNESGSMGRGVDGSVAADSPNSPGPNPKTQAPFFRDVTARARVSAKDMSTSAAWLDYDGDGKLDLFVCRYMDYDVKTNPRCKDFRQRDAYCSPNVYPGTQCMLFRNNGDGTFSDLSKKSGIGTQTGRSLGIACADFNRDGLTDIFVANDLSPNYLFINKGNGTFSEQGAMAGVAYGEAGIARAGMGTDAADYHHDGQFGVLVTNFENEPAALYRNNGDGSFTEESFPSGVGNPTLEYLKWGCKFTDFDLDGWQDIFIANGHVDDRADENGKPQGYSQACQVLRNDGNGAFSDVSGGSGPFFTQEQVARGLAVGDFNNDGKPDVLIASNNGRAILLSNSTQTSNHWVRLTMVGNGCNRDALGTLVTVNANAAKEMQTVHSGGSYLSDHDRRLLFGIGTARSARADVRWPCGALESLDISMDTSVVVKEKDCKLAIGKVVRK